MTTQIEKPTTERYKLVAESETDATLVPYLGRGLFESPISLLVTNIERSNLIKIYHLQRTTVGLIINRGDYHVAISGTSEDREAVVKILESLCNSDNNSVRKEARKHPTIKLEKVI